MSTAGKIMIHDRLQSLDIKITELANYLQISRPTMYKFIDAYDRGDRGSVNPSVLKVFDYISQNALIGKRNVIAYILTNLTDEKSTGTLEQQELIREIGNYVLKNPDSEKTMFIKSCVHNSYYDTAIHYLVEIGPLLTKKRLTAEEKGRLDPYMKIIAIYSK